MFDFFSFDFIFYLFLFSFSFYFGFLNVWQHGYSYYRSELKFHWGQFHPFKLCKVLIYKKIEIPGSNFTEIKNEVIFYRKIKTQDF